MKIYFAGSVTGGRSDAPIYLEIIKLLQHYGEVLTEHLGDQSLVAHVGSLNMTPREVHDIAIERLNNSTHIVAEVTQPSLGVGYKIGYGVSKNIPVLCLYRKLPDRKISSMIIGNPYLKAMEYKNIEEVDSILKEWFQ